MFIILYIITLYSLYTKLCVYYFCYTEKQTLNDKIAM